MKSYPLLSVSWNFIRAACCTFELLAWNHHAVSTLVTNFIGQFVGQPILRADFPQLRIHDSLILNIGKWQHPVSWNGVICDGEPPESSSSWLMIINGAWQLYHRNQLYYDGINVKGRFFDHALPADEPRLAGLRILGFEVYVEQQETHIQLSNEYVLRIPTQPNPMNECVYTLFKEPAEQEIRLEVTGELQHWITIGPIRQNSHTQYIHIFEGEKQLSTNETKAIMCLLEHTQEVVSFETLATAIFDKAYRSGKSSDQ